MMRRSDSSERPRRSGFSRRRRTCYFCDNKLEYVDYKDPGLRNYLTDRGKIVNGKFSGTCTRHQRMVGRAVKIARNLALLPYVAR